MNHASFDANLINGRITMRIYKHVLPLVLAIIALSRVSMAGGVQITAPEECLLTARALLEYLFNDETDIARDHAIQRRWLTVKLQNELEKKKVACTKALTRKPNAKIKLPSNGDFLLTPEPPAAYEVMGSRRYGNIVFIDVEFNWGDGQKYQGNRRIQCYIFLLENEKWKLDDVYHVRESFNSPMNLSGELRSLP